MATARTAEVPQFNHENLGVDLKQFWEDPEAMVVREPIKAVAYWLGISVLGLFVALVFPFLGYCAIGGAFALIGRAMILNRNAVMDKIVQGIDFNNMIRGIFSGERRAPAPDR